MIKLNNLLEQFFGFKLCSIYIEQIATPNACTLPISCQFKSFVTSPRKMIEKTKNGYRYKKEAEYSLFIMITSGLFTDSEYTDEEIAAVIFHEIGHNFSSALDGNLGGLILIRMIIFYIDSITKAIITMISKGDPSAAINLIKQSEFFQGLNAWWLDLSRKIPIIKGLTVLWNTVKAFINGITTFLSDIIEGIFGFNPLLAIAAALAPIMNWPSQIFKLITGGYKDEQIADAFAAMYGLGPNLSSALAKMNNNPTSKSWITKIFQQSPIIGHVGNLFQIPLYVMSTIFDEHPQIGARFKVQTDLLENELAKNNIDPRMKAEIKRQLNEINKEFDTNVRIKTDKMQGIPRAYQRMYQEFLMDKNGGDVKGSLFKTDDVINTINDTDKKLK